MLTQVIDKFFTEVKDKYKDHAELIILAFNIAEKAHINQKRHSGEAYIIHPTRVALSLIEYRFDYQTIIAGLLHDVVEDTDITREYITETFGEVVSNLVMGVTKLNTIHFVSKEVAKVENIRKFILSCIDDIRVLLIKIFDRLDNMQTLGAISKESKRKEIALETLEVYVPLAERISLHKIKDELEDLAFEILEPNIKKVINDKLVDLEENLQDSIDDLKADITELLTKHNIKFYSISGRIKKPYSLWKKMQTKKLSFEEVFDVFAFRIVVEDVQSCYQVLYTIHSKYRAIFSRFKDYISSPKMNNYRSLHTGIIIKNNINVELQIRTQEMQDFAEYGIVSHWNYKNPVKEQYSVNQYSWLKDILNVIQHPDLEIADIYEYTKINVFSSEVFVFTPKGELVSLPKGSSALDFAYSIHSDVGHHCSEVKINGISSPIFSILSNGDTIEIIANNNVSPQVSWLSFVHTGVAKLSIKRYLRNIHKKDVQQQAEAVLHYYFEKEGVKFYAELLPKIINILNIQSESILFEKIIEGKVNMMLLINKLYSHTNIKNAVNHNDLFDCSKVKCKVDVVKISQCCYPIYGDSIVGVVLPNNDIEVHHNNCNLLYNDWSANIMVVRILWASNNTVLHKAKIKLLCKNQIGALANIFNIITVYNINVQSIITEEAEETDLIVSSEIILTVKDINELNKVVDKVNNSPFVQSVERQIN
jgi:guanosine-3',5'-bis(diphosphate) 3'-pyrophosphohydrolase